MVGDTKQGSSVPSLSESSKDQLSIKNFSKFFCEFEISLT